LTRVLWVRSAIAPQNRNFEEEKRAEVRLLGMGIAGGDGGGRDVEMGARDALTWLGVAFSRLQSLQKRTGLCQKP